MGGSSMTGLGGEKKMGFIKRLRLLPVFMDVSPQWRIPVFFLMDHSAETMRIDVPLPLI